MSNNGAIPSTLHDNLNFRNLIKYILSTRALLNPYHIDTILSPHNMLLFEQAFTHPSFDSTSNYEFLEFIGDTTVNKAIVWYCQRRFTHLRNEKGVQTFSQLRSNLVAKKSLSSFASRLDFWSFIRMSKDTQERDRFSVLEDVFEAFIGTLEMVVDECINIHSGYGVCYTIISTLLDETYISLDNKDLKDSKTRLKELFDKLKNLRGLKYVITSPRSEADFQFGITVYGYIDDKMYNMGTGSAPIKRQAEKNAATVALKWLKDRQLIDEDN